MLLPMLLKYVRGRPHVALQEASLPLYGGRAAKASSHVSVSGTSSGATWLFAVGIASACFFTAENAVIGFLVSCIA